MKINKKLIALAIPLLLAATVVKADGGNSDDGKDDSTREEIVRRFGGDDAQEAQARAAREDDGQRTIALKQEAKELAKAVVDHVKRAKDAVLSATVDNDINEIDAQAEDGKISRQEAVSKIKSLFSRVKAHLGNSDQD